MSQLDVPGQKVRFEDNDDVLPQDPGDWSEEQLQRVAEEMRDSVKVRNRTYRFRTYKRCFVAERAVKWLIEAGYATTEDEAVAIGNTMLTRGFFIHVVNPDCVFKNEYSFFRWRSDILPSEKARNKALAKGISIPSISIDSNSQLEAFDVAAAEPASIIGDDVQKLESSVAEIRNYIISLDSELKVERYTAMMILGVLFVIQLVISLPRLFLSVIIVIGLASLAFFSSKQDRTRDKWRAALLEAETLFETPEDSTQVSSKSSESKKEAENSENDPFFIPAEELNRMRMALQREFPDSAAHLTETYIQAVMKTPNKKDPTRRRTFDYARRKLFGALEILEDLQPHLVNPDDLGAALTCGSLYWYGYTKERQPILWVRPYRKDWSNIDVHTEKLLHMFMIEEGIKLMPEGVHSFCIIGETAHMGISHIRPRFMKTLLSLIMNGYPDRLGRVYAGPANLFLRGMYRLIRPLIPHYMANKIQLLSSQSYDELSKHIPPDVIPPHLGGTCIHSCIENDSFNLDTMIGDMQEMRSKIV